MQITKVASKPNVLAPAPVAAPRTFHKSITTPSALNSYAAVAAAARKPVAPVPQQVTATACPNGVCPLLAQAVAPTCPNGVCPLVQPQHPPQLRQQMSCPNGMCPLIQQQQQQQACPNGVCPLVQQQQQQQACPNGVCPLIQQQQQVQALIQQAQAMTCPNGVCPLARNTQVPSYRFQFHNPFGAAGNNYGRQLLNFGNAPASAPAATGQKFTFY